MPHAHSALQNYVIPTRLHLCIIIIKNYSSIISAGLVPCDTASSPGSCALAFQFATGEPGTFCHVI